ncbi:hypothetical protein [Parvimonas micra]|uniref:hypothetical protein n=1 Tax=Parvimonas micra TaxID=33033 RepID=UPI002B48D56A|nr:hypothetical protein [Parvimonas micra]MEB3067259.1 hypothetical protein [Parvimonas micra]
MNALAGIVSHQDVEDVERWLERIASEKRRIEAVCQEVEGDLSQSTAYQGLNVAETALNTLLQVRNGQYTFNMPERVRRAG